MYRSYKKLAVLITCCLTASLLQAQQVDLFKMQDSANKATDKTITAGPVINTFYSTRLVNAHTVEITGPGSMDFRINHRFSPVNQGLYELFGLDGASFRFGFDFGIAKDLMIGVGRTTYNKEYDGFIKYRLMHQSTGAGAMPLSIAVLGSAMYKTIDLDTSLKATATDRLTYVLQLMIARKFNEHTSVQISPTLTHYNRIIGFTGGSSDMLSIGFLARQKVSKRISINAEYFWQANRFNGTYDPLSIGVDIQTGGHVFQLHFTNSIGMNEHAFIHETTGSWGNGAVRWGFNISRIFNISSKNKKGNW
ncbi:hypothetical protein SAMN05444410_10446 [Hydrobacter penzbergensis]|jgi:hypothetical protein|uniref:DUF5777 domain-containing protein n=1 Tax=Hydrobacter penzbergensis TaxID=1235997 RepID=A0A8X8IAY6_9BACT|nr:DUF5777 family beta-barrel protein [Hydrobacter penzbergensis]MBN8719920.1 hypothetical protein [Sediminibacterium magnilacihabitans]PQV60745.1 hypothetical protein CLV53_10511 [Sediminibacterium magnilacihabitans]SDW59343.1 hypothetical protein SAMN05444410_10446 [Hydrobacter penzbergensis]